MTREHPSEDRVVDEALARAAAERDEALRAAQTRTGAFDEDAILAGFRRHVETERPRGLAPLRAPRVAVAAAAAMLLAAVAWWMQSVLVPRVGRLTLGSDEVRLLEPHGRVQEVLDFRWSGDLPRGGTYRLEVWDEAAAPGAPPVLVAPRLTSGVYAPSPGERERLPVRFRWRVVAFDPSGAVVASAEARVEAGGS